MEKEFRAVWFDNDLKVEAYTFKGVIQKFPNHFHDYYVIGFIEKGTRSLLWKNKFYNISKGDIILFNPYENHECEQPDTQILDYRSINIPSSIMQDITAKLIGEKYFPYFLEPILYHNAEILSLIKSLHYNITKKESVLKRKELFFFTFEKLILKYARISSTLLTTEDINNKIEQLANYLKKNYEQELHLKELSKLVNMSEYHLLHTFTKKKGISPYKFLEALRIDEAKKLLEKGDYPFDVAIQTGFHDQSHLTRFFKKFIGVTPSQYRNIFRNKLVHS
jgi:AraC-like DNA-binding protein